MMDDAIRDFAKQFDWQPEIKNVENLPELNKFIVAGMGGSHLGADMVAAAVPELDLIIHSDYGLPEVDCSDRLFIASSYSGNTEEVLNALEKALENNMQTAVIAVGGKLLEIAKEKNLPYIQMPDTGIQPRSALGYSFRGLAKLMGQEKLLEESGQLGEVLKPAEQEKLGEELTAKFKDKILVIYSSARNKAVAYNWKIKMNETGKMPAFYNIIPELNHNEMTGFDVKDSSKHLFERFQFVFLTDTDDYPRNQDRMKVLQKQYEDRGLPVEKVKMTGSSRSERIFTTLILADWIAVKTAYSYGLEAEQVPMVEEFKKLMA